jgi:hypothetical protein
LCGGEVESEWLTRLTATLYPRDVGCEPREAAKEAFMTLGYELPGFELEESFTPPSHQRRSGTVEFHL